MIDYGYVDLHSHSLWGIDDGAPDLETSLEMCRLAHETGTDYLFLTPHLINWSDAGMLYDIREERTEYLQNILYSEGRELTLIKGFEILCGDDIFEVKYFEPYTLNKSRYILIEFSFNRTTEDDVNAWCDYLISCGLVPVIAHPERYEFVKNDVSVIERLSDKGCLFQVNCGSVVGVFGEREANVALRMLYAGYVDFIGSDAHDLRWRTTDMYAFLRDYPDNLPVGVLDDALFTNPQKVINNEKIIPERLNSLLIY
jgi:protein-tyrosine phosphatase